MTLYMTKTTSNTQIPQPKKTKQALWAEESQGVVYSLRSNQPDVQLPGFQETWKPTWPQGRGDEKHRNNRESNPGPSCCHSSTVSSKQDAKQNKQKEKYETESAALNVQKWTPHVWIKAVSLALKRVLLSLTNLPKRTMSCSIRVWGTS